MIKVTESLNPTRRTLWLIALPCAIVAGNLVLKFLELKSLYRLGLDDSFKNFFIISPDMLSNGWKLLLPYSISPPYMRWSTSGIVFVSLLNQSLGVSGTFLLLNILLIVVTFFLSWLVFKSRVFSTTAAICMAFGTQFNHAYANTSVMILYLFVIYIEINLALVYYAVKLKSHQYILRVMFVVSLLLLAVCWEMWIDYFAFIFIAGVLLYWIYRFTIRDYETARNVQFIILSSCCVFIAYIGVKVFYSAGIGEHFTPGLESESVFNYITGGKGILGVVAAADDIFSNYLTYNYIALTNYLPLLPLSSASLFLGKSALIGGQNGYAASYGLNELVYGHYVFTWYLGAGLIFGAFTFFTVKYVYRAIKFARGLDICMAAFIVMIAVGAFAHLFIKYRFYLSLPLYSYKCIVSVVGVSLLIAYLLMMVARKFGTKTAGIILGLAWTVIILAGFSRPLIDTYYAYLLKMPVYPMAVDEIVNNQLTQYYNSLRLNGNY